MKKKLYDLLALDHIRLLWSIKPMRIALLGVLILPLVYSFIYLAAFYDPYENLRNLPVAVVNEDRGAINQQQSIHIGNELVQSLKKDPKLKWEFIPRSQFEKGLDTGDYYFGVIIPEDFSRKVSTVAGPDPLKSELLYVVDESHNYISNQLGSSIMKDVQKKVDEKLSQVYMGNLFAKMHDSTNQLATAAKGAELLSAYTAQAGIGTEKLKTGLTQLTDGTSQIQKGLSQIQGALHPGRDKLEENLDKVILVQTKAHQVNALIQGAVNHATTGSTNIQPIVKRTQDASYESIHLLKRIIKKHPKLKKEPRVAQLLYRIESIKKDNEQLEKLTGISLPHTSSAVRDLAAISQQLTHRVDQGVNELKSTLLQMDQLIQGVSRLEDAEGRVAGGLTRLGDGTGQLENGLQRISGGHHQLAGGLHHGVQRAENQLRGSDQREEVLANPVAVKKQPVHPVPNYATGFAPYFISLALWVGAMILFTVVDLYQVRDKLNGSPISPSVWSLIGIAQAVIATAALTLGLGIHAILPGWLFLFTILMSLTFMAINQMLVILFRNFGRFLAIIILMCQLASCSGTYPFQLLPEFFQVLHSFLPMTYTVEGLRAILSNGNMEVLMRDVIILFGYLGGAYLVMKAYERLKNQPLEVFKVIRRGS